MNPFLLLLGLAGVGALSELGALKKESDLKNPKSTDTSGDPVTEPTDPVVTDEPADPPVADDPIVISDDTPTPPVQTGGTGEDGGEVANAVAEGTVDVIGGRVATLDPAGDDIAGIRLVSGVEHGNLTVNPDGTLALVMTQSDFTGSQSFTYEATHTDGSLSTHDVTLNVTPGLQEGGWATGETHYMLAADENDRVIVEHGENHTKVYVSASEDALSLADIAAIEGVNVSTITGDWLAAHGAYGQSEGMALAQDAGMALWHAITPEGSETSNWLLLESGYEYNDLGRIFLSGTHGESEMNPLYFGAWGDGDKPVMNTILKQFQDGSTNVVVQGIHFTDGVKFQVTGENILFDDITLTQTGMVIMDQAGVTVRNSEFFDIHKEAPSDPDGWNGVADRTQGLFANFNDGLLLEGNVFDMIGWEEGFDPNQDPSAPQPSSMYSHNMYIGANNTDVTLTDTISMRAASFGANIRPGGFIEDNIFIDNNAALNNLGGDYRDAGPVGEYALITDNVVTSGAHKDASYTGALTMGINDEGQLTSLVDNIVTHLANPDDPAEYEEKYWTHDALDSTNPYYNDTIVYNWAGSRAEDYPSLDSPENVDGLDTSVLDQTTIQQFTAALLGKPDATIADLGDYLRAQASGAFDDIVDADLIIRFFQEGFGITPDIRGDATTLTFVPDELGDGVRWDNRMNWDTDDLPGTQDGDSVDLNGNHVVFGTNATIDMLDFGPGGALNVYGGKLTATGTLSGNGDLNVEGAGQIWAGGSDGADIDITVTGGRFANTGDMSGADLSVSGGQAILATDNSEYDVEAEHRLEIAGSAKAGFDGDMGGTAILDLHGSATLSFVAGAEGLGEIAEFRSGAFGDAPDVQSGIDLGGATLEIDLAGLSADAGSAFTLMSADEIAGVFEAANVGGLGARDATIVIDYETDSVTLKLAAGTGSVSVETLGAESDVTTGNETLWNALTADHGTVDETALAMLPEDEDEPLITAA